MATPRKKNPKRRGRKTDYKPEHKDQAYKYALLGLTDVEMSNLFGVTEKTFNNWKKRYPEFLQSINNGKEPADAEIAHSLNERAKGYSYIEHVPTKVKKVEYENGKRVREIEEVVVTPVERHVPPDTRAIQYWMNNRRRKRTLTEEPTATPVWADRQEIDHTTDGEKLPAMPMVYLPQDLPREVVEEQAPPA